MKKLAAMLIVFGVGLLIYGLLDFHASGASYFPEAPSLGGRYIGYEYDLRARLEAASGGMLLTAGVLLKRLSTKRE